MDSPRDLGLPHISWRPGQWDMVYDIAQRLTPASPDGMINAPTGFGKSLTYLAIAALTGWRVAILTSTKALQDQLTREFSDWGLIDVKGRTNYPCRAAERPDLGLSMFFKRNRAYTTAEGPCRRGITCPLREMGCDYFDRIREAARSQVFTTNYDFWFHKQPELGPIDLLVLDEAHQAPDELADYLSFRLTPDHRRAIGAAWPEGEDVKEWRAWAAWAADRAANLLDSQLHKEDEHLRELKFTLEGMCEMLGAGEWVIEHGTDGRKGNVSFDCIDPEAFGRRKLWGSAKRRLLVSATVNLMTAKALGMDPKTVKVWEGKSNFPVSRRPVYVVQGATRLNFRSTEGEKLMWSNLADRVIAARRDRKGIFHTHSFERAKFLLVRSRQRDMMILNESRNTATTVASFRRGGAALLVSPSLTTGWDFPFTECEYQIIGKIPFPDLRTKAARARNARNKEWAGYTAAQTIVQASGRGMRAADDQCETFIIDGNFDWWFGQNKKFLPKWWQESLVWVTLATLPQPLPKLTVPQKASPTS